MRGRFLLFVLLVSAWVVVIALRLYQLQVRRYDHYIEKAEDQQQRTVKLDPPRGTIYDARGRELAVSVEVDSVFAVPGEISDPEAVARGLAPLLGLDRRRLVKTLAAEREFVWVARKLDRVEARAVRELETPGIYFLQESKRSYPMGRLAAHVLGYVGTDNQGLGGLESAYDRVISGQPAWRTVLLDARREHVLSPAVSFADAEPGRDLYLTVDATLQYLAERELARSVERFGAKAGSVVILDPRDSALLAMASHPSFDPNDFTEFSSREWRNRAVMDAYEPGSTFKMVTAAAALEHGVVHPNDIFDCEEGGITLSRTLIRDHRPFGLLTFREVVALSSNVGAIKTAQLLTDADYHRMIAAFGFGRPTGVDLPGESAGILRPVESWSSLTKAYVSFGQGVSVTPLQLANALAAVANGGRLMRPYVVSAVGEAGEIRGRPSGPGLLGRPLSPSTARSLVDILESVVTEGTGRGGAIPGYRVAGKTGTGQKAVGGRISNTRFVVSFVGVAPAWHPRLVCLIMLDEPRARIHGRDLAPAFSSVVGQALLYLGVPPEPERWPGRDWLLRRKRGQLAAVQPPLVERDTTRRRRQRAFLGSAPGSM